MKTCVIIEDEQAAISIVDHLARKEGALNVAATFTEATKALGYLNTHTEIDIVFLDVHLPDMTGFAFLDALTTKPKVILTTADKQVALAAYDFELVIDYLVKPLQKYRFIQAINKC